MTNHHPNSAVTVTLNNNSKQTSSLLTKTEFSTAQSPLAELTVQGVTMLSCAAIAVFEPAQQGHTLHHLQCTEQDHMLFV